MKKFINWKLLLIGIVFFAFFLRFYQLGEIPTGLTNDEANAGYDVYSLIHTAKDQWNNFLPVNNFIGFGDYPPPIYRYLSLVPIAFFGLNEFSVRFVSALAGVFSVISLFYLVKRLVNYKAGLFSSFVLALMPWAIGLSRVAVESNVAILFLVISLIFGLTQKTRWSLYLSVIFLVLSMYTYSAHILYAPLVLCLVFYFNLGKDLRYGVLFKPLLLFLILISPIVFQKASANVRISQVGLTTNINSIGLISTLNDERGQCQIVFNSSLCKLANNKIVLFSGEFVKNYLSHFSPNFLYTSGTVTQFSILPKRGLDYLFNFLPLLFGIAYIFRNKQKKLSIVLFSLFLLSPIPDSITGDGNYSRASIMQPFLALFSGIGIFYILSFPQKYKNLKTAVMTFVILFILLGSFSFFVVYLSYFKNNYSIYSQYGYKELMEKVSENKNNYDRIYLSKHLNDTKQYIYYLFYTKYDPVKYQSKKDVSYSKASDGWYSVDKIENIYFVQNPPVIKDGSPISKENILIISNPVDFAKELKAKFLIRDKLGNVLFEAVELRDILEYNRNQALQKLKNV